MDRNRRDFLKKAAYIPPSIVVGEFLPAAAAYASQKAAEDNGGTPGGQHGNGHWGGNGNGHGPGGHGNGRRDDKPGKDNGRHGKSSSGQPYRWSMDDQQDHGAGSRPGHGK